MKNFSLLLRIALLGWIAIAMAMAARAQIPPNDNLANASSLNGTNVVMMATTVNATAEVGEPSHVGSPAVHSIWFTWTAPDVGSASVDLLGSVSGSKVAVYEGKYLNSLTLVASNAFANVDGTGRCIFKTVAGTVYDIVVDTSSTPGVVQLNLKFTKSFFPPQITQAPKDLSLLAGGSGSFQVSINTDSPASYQWFLNSTPIVGATNAILSLTNVSRDQAGTNTVVITNGGGTASASARFTVNSRPVNDDFGQRILLVGSSVVTMGSNQFATSETGEPSHGGWTATSVWWSWVAPTNGQMSIEVTHFNAGNQVLAIYTGNSVDRLSPAGNSAWIFPPLKVQFNVTTGTAYQIAVAGANGATGPFDLSLSFTAMNFPPVITEQPVGQTTFQGSNAVFQVVALSALPLSYEWQQNGAPVVGATGSSLTLPNVQPSQAGEYRVLISSSGGSVTSSSAPLVVLIRPPNDNFANRITISGNDVSAGGTDRYATSEPGEPLHGSGGPGASVWWTWTPSVVGRAVVEVTGFSGSQALAIYRGSSWSQLAVVRSNTFTGGPLLTHFAAYPGTNYQFTVTDLSGTGSAFSLHTTLSISNFAPTFVISPYDTNVIESDTLIIPTVVQSDFPVHFQWYFNGTPVEGGGGAGGGDFGGGGGGAGGIGVGGGGGSGGDDGLGGGGLWDGSLKISPTGSNWDGNFSVVVTNYSGVVTSRTNHVTVNGRPSNDNFTNRIVFSGTNVTINGTTQFATLETAEPKHTGLSAGGSVWWSWQAPGDGTAYLTTTKTNSAFQNIGIYSGGSLGSLTTVAENSAAQTQVSLNFPVTGGSFYQIAVSGAATPFQLGLQFIDANVPPQIVQQPSDQTLPVGGRAVFQVLATGGGVLNYQWYFKDAAIIASTNFSLLLNNVQTNQAGVYQVVVSNRGGSVTSSYAKLNVTLRPINDNFADRLALSGSEIATDGSDQNATLEATEPAHAGWGPGKSVWWTWTAPASGIMAIEVTNYVGNQVFAVYNGNLLGSLSEVTNRVWFSGPLAASMPVSTSNIFQIAVAGVSGSSGDFKLKLHFKEVNFPPKITTQPLDRIVTERDSTSFSVAATSDSLLSYQWQFGTNSLLGATNATLQITNAKVSQAGAYRVIVSNLGGSVTSLNANLRVNARPLNDDFTNRILLSGNHVVTNGSNQYASSEVDEPHHAGFGPFGSVWWSYTAPAFGILQIDLTNSFNGASLAVYTGTNLSQLSLVASNKPPGVIGTGKVTFLGQSNTTYQIAVQGQSGISGPVRLSILGIFPPEITVQPQDQAVAPGEEATFGVVARSDLPLRYQWAREGGSDILGETNATLRVPGVGSSEVGKYLVRVMNDVGSTQSNPAELSLTTVLKGQITDAIDGRVLSGVTVTVGTHTEITDTNGVFRLGDIHATALKADFDASTRTGNAPLTVQFFDQSTFQTVVLIAVTNGYSSYTNRQVSIVNGIANTNNFSLSPILPPDTMRLVLNWAGEPRDLDAHLVTPKIDTQPYHVYYQTGRRGSLTNNPFAALDIDRTNGFGPETITIQKFFGGSYHYYIRKFSGIGSLAGSGASVKIYTEAGLVRTVRAPEAGGGDFWDVCSIDGETRAVTVINQVGTIAPNREDQPVSAFAGPKPNHSTGLDLGPAAPAKWEAQPHQSPLPAAVGISDYLWTFGDGATSAEPNPTHTYAKPGIYTVGLTLADSNGDSQAEVKTDFIQVLGIGNQPPSLSLIANRVTLEDTPTPAIALIVNDLETSAAILELKVAASDAVLLPPSGIRLGGSGSNRTITLTPAKDQFGVATISVVVKDAEGLAATNQFDLTVISVNDPPTLDLIADVAVDEDAPRKTIGLKGISTGAVNELQSLEITATSSNPGLIPNPAVGYTSPNPSGTLSLQPLPNANGVATINVTVKDNGGVSNGGQDTVSRQFTVTVNPVNDPPAVTLTAPNDGESFAFGTNILLTASANDIDGSVAKVEFFEGTNKLGETLIIPYSLVWSNAPAGPHALRAVATDSGGLRSTSAPVNIAVELSCGINLLLNGNAELGIGSSNALEVVATPIWITTGNFTVAQYAAGAIDVEFLGPADPGPTNRGNNYFAGGPTNLSSSAFQIVNVSDKVATIDGGKLKFALSGYLGGFSAAARNDDQEDNAVLIAEFRSNSDGKGTRLGTTSIGPVTSAERNHHTGLVLRTTNGPVPVGTRSIVVTLQMTRLQGIYNDGYADNLSLVLSGCDGDTAPTVTITDPLDGSTFSGSIDLTLTAAAKDADGNISKVDFYAETNKLGTATTAPYTIIWNNAPPGNFVLEAVATDNDGLMSTSAPVRIIVILPNAPPTLAPIGDTIVNEDAQSKTINLTGISTGATNEIQSLTVTATSSNPAVVPNPTVIYSSPSATGTLTFQPLPNANGTATITVTIKDSGGTANGGQDTFSRQFAVAVTPVNDPPTLARLADVRMNEDDAAKMIDLLGISTGATNEVQTLAITATSSNPSLIPNPTVTYASPSATGMLTFQPLPNANGTATITVTVKDSGGIANGGQDTISRQFKILVGPVNDPPIVSLTTPDKGASFTYGAPILIEATAEDVDSPVSKVEFFDGPIKLSENLKAPYSFIWSNAPAGSHALTAKATDIEGASAISLSIPISVVARTNEPPAIQLISPPRFARFEVGTIVRLAAMVTATNQPLSRVEYFAGSELLGAATNPLVSPYPVEWSPSNVGDYFLTAKAVFRDATTISSAPVRVVVLKFGDQAVGNVAIVTPTPSEERALLEEAILDLGYLPDVYLQEDLTSTTLLPYRLVIWDDLGDLTHKLTSRTAGLLTDVFGPSTSLYLIGEALTRSTSDFSASTRESWLKLLHFKTIAGRTSNAPPVDFDFQPIREDHNVLLGQFGSVQNFVYPGTIESDLNGLDTESAIDVLGKAGSNVVVLMHPRLTDADANQDLARSISQAFLVSNGTDADSLRERRTLFMNGAYWLLRRQSCLDHQVNATQFPVDSDSVPEVGKQFKVRINLGIGNSECPADGIRLSAKIPPGVELIDVANMRGSWTFEDSVLKFNLGRAIRNQDEIVTLTLQAASPGTFTNLLQLRWNELTNVNLSEGIFTVIPSSRPRLNIRAKLGGGFTLHVQSRADEVCTIQTSPDLVRWSILQRVDGGDHDLELPPAAAKTVNYFRATVP